MTPSPTEPSPTDLAARLRANPLAVDAFIAVGLTAVSLITIVGGARDLGSYDPLSLVLLVLTTMPLIARRRWPLAVFAICFGATFAHAALAREALSTTLGFLIALYTVGEYRDRRVSALAAIVTAVSVGLLISVRAPMPAGLSGLVQTELAILAAWVLGIWARDRRRQIDTAEDRAGRLEAEREERDRLAVAEERERIARELHDVVTHHVSVIVIQAGAAERALDRRPADAREAIKAIDSTARQALADMRRMLGILGRPGAGGAGGREGDLAPMPGLDRLGELLEQVRSAGMPVQLSVTGERRALDPGIELSAYRIIQEALTNALRYAPGAPTRVAVGYGPTALEIQVDDEGARSGGEGADAGAGLGGSGRGLIGMRERVAVFGGEFEAYSTGRGFPCPRPAAAWSGRVVSDRIRVLLVDDQQLVRTGFRMILADEPDIEVIGEATNGSQAVELTTTLDPDVIVMDIRMPIMDGLEATRRIVADTAVRSRVLILTTFDADEYVVEALRAGASGFVLKDVPPDDFAEAIRTIAAGDALLAPSVTRQLLDRFRDRLPAPPGESDARLRDLTDRELEVVKLVARGLSNREIADRLVLAEPTVKTHVSHALLKLDLRDRAQAVVLAYEAGLVRPGSPDD